MKISNFGNVFNLKVILLVIGLGIALATYFYTENLVYKLQEREREIVELYAASFNYIADSESGDADLTFVFEKIIKRIDFPLILTDANNNISYSDGSSGVRNIDLSEIPDNEVLDFLNEKVKELSEIREPIPVTFQDTIILAKIYYGNSDLVKQLKFYPYLQIMFAIGFVLIAYISFSYIKRSEQSNIWVGMAKETAHQLGTPISSLMGWNELLRMQSENKDKVLDISEEIESDLARLNKITIRFSKIGSTPELKEKNIFEVVEKVTEYFKRRLPNSGRKVEVYISGSKNLSAKINTFLFEWVIENLTKNAIDAIDNKPGKIEFVLIDNNKNVEIEISDNGKGIDLKHRKDIFRPGFSTKKRGWGLGLSLAKRIIEDYHNGKIFVKHSAINEGTTFKIVLHK